MRRVTALAVLLAATVWIATRPGDATACGIVVPRVSVTGTPSPRVETADEAAYIVWDERNSTQHFIRRATFTGTATDFGFLVPTPSRPELRAVDDALFDTLARATAPRIEYREQVKEVTKRFEFNGCLGTNANSTFSFVGSAIKPGGASPGTVQVLEQTRVGDFDATVLTFRRGAGEDAATGAAELGRWLTRNGYHSSPRVTRWLARYVEDQWCLTAFKIAGTPAARGSEFRAAAVRMSFRTERPFYPYREPEAEWPATAPRLLRVYFAASARFAGKLGDGPIPWPGQTVWAGPVGDHIQSDVFARAGVPRLSGQSGWWLTEFEDRSSPRPGIDEVYFERSTNNATLERPPHVVTQTREVVVTPWWHGAVWYLVLLTVLALFLLPRVFKALLRG